MIKKLPQLFILVVCMIVLGSCTKDEIDPNGETINSTAQVGGQNFTATLGQVVKSDAMLGITYTDPNTGTITILVNNTSTGDYTIQAYGTTLSANDMAYAFFTNKKGVRYAAQSGTVKLTGQSETLAGTFSFQAKNFQDDVISIEQGDFKDATIKTGAVAVCQQENSFNEAGTLKSKKTYDAVGNLISMIAYSNSGVEVTRHTYEYTVDGVTEKFNYSYPETYKTQYNSLNQPLIVEGEAGPYESRTYGGEIVTTSRSEHTYNENSQLIKINKTNTIYKVLAGGQRELVTTTTEEFLDYKYDEKGYLISYRIKKSNGDEIERQFTNVYDNARFNARLVDAPFLITTQPLTTKRNFTETINYSSGQKNINNGVFDYTYQFSDQSYISEIRRANSYTFTVQQADGSQEVQQSNSNGFDKYTGRCFK